jgi:RNA polymerase sigma-70 factor, ECF subfamily
LANSARIEAGCQNRAIEVKPFKGNRLAREEKLALALLQIAHTILLVAEEDSFSEPGAFDRLYREQSSAIRRFLRRSIRNPATADDLTQEAFLHLLRRPASFNPERGDIKAYLLGIAWKKALDWRRHNKLDTAPIAEQGFSPANGLVIRDALNQLPEDMRVVLWLREVEGYSYQELAKILKLPIGTVRSRLHSARQQLRTIWTRRYDELHRS